ncbi:hypothetical protein PSTT_14839 [Puccinia striiformis]|uniref:Uncharacterized protein n=1 Tax=Puccinia striiformis TaxID=27350 RepID=A0A2S4UKS7_9BASI|nr:hypothetical protein PSTT_14839 [Puccinia striiformis]
MWLEGTRRISFSRNPHRSMSKKYNYILFNQPPIEQIQLT